MTKLILSPSRISKEFDSIFNDFFNGSLVPKSGFSPRTNIVELDDKVIMKFELPGMEKDEIKILIKDDVLTVSGERKTENEVEAKNYYHREMVSGTFSRSFGIPDNIKTDKINASYKNGILEISLEKKEEAKPKEIEVKVS